MSLGYFIDVQGTLLSDYDKSPINGAIEIIEHLNKTKIPYIVITNNTKEKSEDFLNSLHVKGFDIPKENYLDPFMVLASVVKEKEVSAFGPDAFKNVLKAKGYELTDDAKNLLIASYNKFDSNDYASMIELVLKGAKITGMHGTSIYAKEGRKHPGVGAILQMLTFATGVSSKVVGKPSDAFYAKALEKIKAQDANLEFKDIVMISDDATGDLKGAKELDMKTCLVLSGKCGNVSEVEHVMSSLDAIYNDIGVILEEIS